MSKADLRNYVKKEVLMAEDFVWKTKEIKN